MSPLQWPVASFESQLVTGAASIADDVPWLDLGRLSQNLRTNWNPSSHRLQISQTKVSNDKDMLRPQAPNRFATDLSIHTIASLVSWIARMAAQAYSSGFEAAFVSKASNLAIAP